MQNTGNQHFTYDMFKLAYDSDPKLQDIVADFDQNMIKLKTSEVDDIKRKPAGDGGNKISQMAKRAVDI